MKLVDLNPHYVDAGGPGIYDGKTGKEKPRRTGVGMILDCPCGCGVSCYLQFKNPLDGGEQHSPDEASWSRQGDKFETMTLAPSVLRSKEKGGCGWHGWIRNGEVIPC